MPEARKRCDREFREGAVRIVETTDRARRGRRRLTSWRHRRSQALGGPLGDRGDGPVAVAAFIAAQREQHQVPHATACRALGVSQAWFYKWRDGDASPQHARRVELAAEIARLFAKHHGRYGSPRITADLREAGERVSENTVAKVMRDQQLVARGKKRRKQTTRQGRGRWRAADLIGRDFPADQLDRKWYGDGTEILTDEGKLFLNSVLDMGSRRIVGFALGEHHDAAPAYDALAMAVAVRGGRQPITGVIFHSDQGSEPSATPTGSTPPVPSGRWAAGATA